MDRLRRRERNVFSGFTDSEIEKLEKLFEEFGKQSLNQAFCLKISKSFSRLAGRAGKPLVKWHDVQSWFENRQLTGPLKPTPSLIQPMESTPSPDVSKDFAAPDASEQKKANDVPQVGETIPDISELEFEARSPRDGAWYDVEKFLTHRFVSSGGSEVCVRYVGFGEEEDEWVSVKKDIRERSIPLEDWECHKVKPGDVMLCLQERKDHALYYDAHILKIESKMHDVRGCRCIFFIQYDHDNTQEKVGLSRLCRRP